MTNTRCPIWGTPATEEPTERDGRLVHSPRVGGKYFISGTAEEVLKAHDDHLKVRLTSWMVEQRRLGDLSPEIHTGTISEAQQRRNLRISERAEGVLRYLETRSNMLGEMVSYRVFIALYDTVNVDEHEREYFGLLSHAGCVGPKDLSFLLDYLDERGLVKNNVPHDETSGSLIEIKGCTLTVEGYARLAELDGPNTVSSKAFMAMWFDPSMNDAWERGFEPAIRKTGYEPVRIDQKEHINKIDDEIIAEIKRARFVVADFTHGCKGARGGVYYEAGFASGLDIPVIFTCQENMLKKIHFDTRQFNHIPWKDPEDLQYKLKNRIAAVIGDGPERVFAADKNRTEPQRGEGA